MFEELVDVIDNLVIESLNMGAQQADSLMAERIFTKNQSIDGTSFGKYNSKDYIEYRLSLGRQVNEKDLQLTGNLLKSIVVEDNKVIFSNPIDAKKARQQETDRNQINKPIFGLSKDEEDDCIRVIDEVFVRGIKNISDGITVTL